MPPPRGAPRGTVTRAGKLPVMPRPTPILEETQDSAEDWFQPSP